MIPGAVHRSPEIYFTAEKTPENLSLETADDGSETSHLLKWGPFPPNEVGMIFS